jgi:hypothetical protein
MNVWIQSNVIFCFGNLIFQYATEFPQVSRLEQQKPMTYDLFIQKTEQSLQHSVSLSDLTLNSYKQTRK